MLKQSFVSILFAGVIATPAFSQVEFTGTTQSYLYSYETADGDQRGDFYQGLRFRAWLHDAPQLQLRSYMRVARRGDPGEWEARWYNGSLRWKPDSRVDLRLGRQFLYDGVINASSDAFSVAATPTRDIRVRFVAGLETPRDRAFEFLSPDDGYVLGGFASGRFARQAKLDVSYFQRNRSDNLVWQVAGASLTGQLLDGLTYLAQLDYNLQDEDYQRMRYRLSYATGPWTVSGEFQSQKPQVFEDSYFNIFSLNAYQQIRGAVYRQFGQYQVGIQNYYTLYDESETGNEIIGTLSARWGTIGVVYQSGFGGDRIGLYGEARYALTPKFEARARSSYYNFQRYTADFDEDATSFSAGLRYNAGREVTVDAELQESLNSLYDNDLRLLFRVSYRLSTI
ncbi:MAG: hypothetical protein HKN37_01840 [Rhodothermales bacterium]|nr:hypothetical protein [Rhodothermales bacterium]